MVTNVLIFTLRDVNELKATQTNPSLPNLARAALRPRGKVRMFLPPIHKA